MNETILDVARVLCIILISNFIVLMNVGVYVYLKELKTERKSKEEADSCEGLTAAQAYNMYLDERAKREKAEYDLLMNQIEKNQGGAQR